MTSIYDFEVTDIKGNAKRLESYKGKVLLIVNVASECGLTPQYQQLQELYNTFKEEGLEVLGFPCNQFGAQEPGSNEEIATFCELKYKIDFPLFAKIEVNGEAEHPLYTYLKAKKPGDEKQDIEWNFAKFLIDRNGEVVARFHPKVEPREIEDTIKNLL